MNVNYKISVIIPVYNSQLYIRNTLDSVCNQTIFEDIEVIIIDDGSSDESLKICKEYNLKHSNIKVFSQSNQGVSVARNNGLKQASGNYITFLDSDDFVEKDLYEKELNLITKTAADIAIIDFYKQHQDGKNIKYRNEFHKEWCDRDQFMKEFFSGSIGNQVVDKIFASNIAKKITFPEKYKIGEDMWFMFNALNNSKKVVIDTSITGYYYIVRESSAMTGVFSEKYFEPMDLSKKMCDEVSENEILKKYAKAHLIHETCKSLEYVYRHHAEKTYIQKVTELKQELNNYSVWECYSILVRKQFFGFVLMRISPKLYLLVHKIMKIG